MHNIYKKILNLYYYLNKGNTQHTYVCYAKTCMLHSKGFQAYV